MPDRALQLKILQEKIKSEQCSIDHWYNCISGCRNKLNENPNDPEYLEALPRIKSNLERDEKELERLRSMESRLEHAIMQEIEEEFGNGTQS